MTPVRVSDLATLRTLAHPLAALGLGWEDIAVVLARELPPSIGRDDIKYFVIPKLKKDKTGDKQISESQNHSAKERRPDKGRDGSTYPPIRER